MKLIGRYLGKHNGISEEDRLQLRKERFLEDKKFAEKKGAINAIALSGIENAIAFLPETDESLARVERASNYHHRNWHSSGTMSPNEGITIWETIDKSIRFQSTFTDQLSGSLGTVDVHSMVLSQFPQLSFNAGYPIALNHRQLPQHRQQFSDIVDYSRDKYSEQRSMRFPFNTLPENYIPSLQTGLKKLVVEMLAFAKQQDQSPELRHGLLRSSPEIITENFRNACFFLGISFDEIDRETN